MFVAMILDGELTLKAKVLFRMVTDIILLIFKLN